MLFTKPRCDEQKRHLNAVDLQRNRGAVFVARGSAVWEGYPMNFFRLADGSKQERDSESQTNSESRGRGEAEARVPLGLAPLMGRDTELSLLKDRWEQAQEGMGQVVLVIGEAGLGKSRLVQTLAQRVQAHGSDAACGSAWRIRERGGRQGRCPYRVAMLRTVPELGALSSGRLSGALPRARA